MAVHDFHSCPLAALLQVSLCVSLGTLFLHATKMIYFSLPSCPTTILFIHPYSSIVGASHGLIAVVPNGYTYSCTTICFLPHLGRIYRLHQILTETPCYYSAQLSNPGREGLMSKGVKLGWVFGMSS